MTNPVHVELGPGELATAATIAALRQGVNREAGKKNLKAGPQDVMTTELVGLYGELAFCKWANVMPDLTTHLRAGSHDAIWRGFSVDVKSTRNAQGDLYVDMRTDKRPDIYVLAHVDYATVRLLGWIPSDCVTIAARMRTSNLEPYRVPQSELYSVTSTPTSHSE